MKRKNRYTKKINSLREEIFELKYILEIWDNREYRSRFLTEWRAEKNEELKKAGIQAVAGHPDGDYIYKLYFELRDENEKLKEINTEYKNKYGDVK